MSIRAVGEDMTRPVDRGGLVFANYRCARSVQYVLFCAPSLCFDRMLVWQREEVVALNEEKPVACEKSITREKQPAYRDDAMSQAQRDLARGFPGVKLSRAKFPDRLLPHDLLHTLSIFVPTTCCTQYAFPMSFLCFQMLRR